MSRDGQDDTDNWSTVTRYKVYIEDTIFDMICYEFHDMKEL